MHRKTLTLAALAAAALTLAIPAAFAAPAPSASLNATGTEDTSNGSKADHQEIAASWSLGQNEYACAITFSSSAAERTLPLDPSATGATAGLAASGGSTVTVTLQWVAVTATTAPGDACFQPRQTSSTTLTAGTYTPPAPTAPTETSSTPAATTPTPTTSTPTTTDTAPAVTTTDTAPAVTAPTTTAPTTTELDTRIKALEDQIAALTSRVDRLEKAVDAAWLAYEQELTKGTDPATAADIARGTYLNAVYGLGAFAPKA